MRLKKPCEHDQYDAHRYSPNADRYFETCPGGEFLADDALIIEKVEGEWPTWLFGVTAYLARPRSESASPSEIGGFLDALTVREDAG